MEINLNDLWNELQKESSDGNRAKLLASWKHKRFQKLKVFRKLANELKPDNFVESVPWEDVITTKGYVIDRNRQPLYEGAVSSAYHARKQFSGETIYCKLYQTKKFCEAHGISCLKQQLTNLLILKNDRIVAVEKAFEVKNTQKMYLFMFLPKFGSAADFMSKHRSVLSMDIAKRWCRDICSGLVYMHALGIAHNNVTLSALLMESEQGDLKLSAPDTYTECFGESENHVVMHKANRQFSPYFSYEKMYMKEYEPTAADMWQMASILYYVLTLQHPFNTRRSSEDMKMDMDSRSWAFVGEYDSTQLKLDAPTKEFLGKLFVPEASRLISIEALHDAYLS